MYVRSINITLIFLIKFYDKDHFEKQQIDIAFSSQQNAPEYDSDLPIPLRRRFRPGINLRISHTARTWGADMESLISGVIEKLLINIPKHKEFISKNKGKAATILFFSILTTSIGAIYFTFDNFYKSKLAELNISKNLDHIEKTTKHEMEYIVNTIGMGIWERALLTTMAFMIISIIFASIISILISAELITSPASFILLTDESEKMKIEHIKQSNNMIKTIIYTTIGGILIGVLGNIAYALTFEHLMK